MAALSSVAWVTNKINKNLIPSKTVRENGVDIRYWKIPFYFPNGNYEVSEKFWLDQGASPYYCYGRSCQIDEIWPAVYEKAYAYKLSGGELCNVSGAAWPNNASPPLVQITGWTANPFTKVINVDTNPDTLYTDLKSRCNGDEGNGQKLKRPTVAWTRNNAPLGVNQMRPDHAYAVLGVYYTDLTNYVVLRNPLGKSEGADNPDALVGGAWGASVNDSLYTSAGAVVPGSVGVHAINFDSGKGIFALKVSKFRDYFSGYAWV